MNENQNDPAESLEVLAPSAVFAMEKANIDIMVATAHAYPRSLELFKKRGLAMVCLDEETAESCIYCRPVGKEKDPKTGEWKEKFAEGASIRMAEIVACAYGNIRVASKIIEQTPRYVKCEGVAHDLESNYGGKSEVMESTVTKDGIPYSERHRALIAKVALAKAYRDAIFKVIPKALCKPLVNAANKIISGSDKPLEERRKKVQSWVGTLKIDESRVFAVLGVKGWSEVMDEHLLILTGLKTGIADGERIDDTFPRLETATKGPELPKGPKTIQKTTPEPSKPVEAVTTAPKASESQTDSPGNAPEGKTTPSEGPSDAEVEASMGLAPATLETVPGAVAEMASETPENSVTDEPAYQPDPKLAPRSGESDALSSVKLLASKSGVTASQVIAWAQKNKLAREGQQLSDLSENKLIQIGQKWNLLVTKMREFPR